jgi:hypothetical protein
MNADRNIIVNPMHVPVFEHRHTRFPMHFFPGPAVEVYGSFGTLEYPVIAPVETRAKMRGGLPEDHIIEVETCVAYSVESQTLVAACLSYVMEFHPESFKAIMEYAKKQSDLAGENKLEEN